MNKRQIADKIVAVKLSREYREIQKHYGERRAERSQVPLMNHINEGLNIMASLGHSEISMRAFALHPIFQDDESLVTVGCEYACRSKAEVLTTPRTCKVYREWSETAVVFLAMEYRYVANAALPGNWHNGMPEISLEETREMLIADKVQNFKDFEIYHKATHPDSVNLTCYFREWLQYLGVSPQRYAALKRVAAKGYGV